MSSFAPRKAALARSESRQTGPLRLGELLHLSAIADRDLAGRLAAAGTDGLHRLDDVVPFDALAKDHVLAVQVRRRGRADEELRAVGVRPGIRHRERAGTE